MVNGTHWMHVRALNGSGLWSTTSHFQVRIDDTAPGAPTITSSTHPTQTDWYAQPNATLSFAKTDTAPVNGYSWVLDQNATTTPDTTSEGPAGTATVTPGEGTYYFHVRARNSSGLWSTTSHYTLKTDAVTGSSSISSSTHPDQDVWYPSRAVEAAWTATEESGIAGYATSVTPDGPGDPGTTVNTTGPSASIGVAEDRVWYFNVRVKSNTGVWGPIASYRIKADSTQPPTPTVTSSTHSNKAVWYANNDPVATIAATDVSGITGYSYTLDQSADTIPDTSSEGVTTTLNFSDLADGVWYLHVRAGNGAGLWSNASHFPLQVDTTAPILDGHSVNPEVVPVDSEATFTAYWDTSASPVVGIFCKSAALVDGVCTDGEWARGTYSGGGESVAYRTFGADETGHHYYVAFACDAAGLCSEGGGGTFDVTPVDDGVPSEGITSAYGGWEPAAEYDDIYYPNKWDPATPHYWQFSRYFPTGDPEKTARIHDGLASWMDHARSTGHGPRVHFRSGLHEGGRAWTLDCNEVAAKNSRVTVVTWGDTQFGGGAHATATPCVRAYGGEDFVMQSCLITMEKDIGWYEGRDFGHDDDLWGVAAHEWGHCMGSFGGPLRDGHFPSGSAACGTNAATMCSGGWWDNSATKRSLENPDKLEFARAYAQGHWWVTADGRVYNEGWARHVGDAAAIKNKAPIVGMAHLEWNNGYWLASSDGGVFSFGDAPFRGSLGGIRLNAPIVAIVPHYSAYSSASSSGGYWLVAADGGIFAFGSAKFYGSMGGHLLNQPIVGMAATPSGNGYWLVAADGGVFNFGDAPFHGSMGGVRLAQPVVGIAGSGKTGGGYWMVAKDGAVFSFGSAQFHGSAYGQRPPEELTFVGISRTRRGDGYNLFAWDATNNGANVRRFGDAPFFANPDTGIGSRVVGGAMVGSMADEY